MIASNLKSLPGNVTVEKGGIPFDTIGLRKFGALIGDGAVINPGANWRGIPSANNIAKNRAQIEVAVRRPRET